MPLGIGILSSSAGRLSGNFRVKQDTPLGASRRTPVHIRRQ